MMCGSRLEQSEDNNVNKMLHKCEDLLLRVSMKNDWWNDVSAYKRRIAVEMKMGENKCIRIDAKNAKTERNT